MSDLYDDDWNLKKPAASTIHNHSETAQSLVSPTHPHADMYRRGNRHTVTPSSPISTSRRQNHIRRKRTKYQDSSSDDSDDAVQQHVRRSSHLKAHGKLSSSRMQATKKSSTSNKRKSVRDNDEVKFMKVEKVARKTSGNLEAESSNTSYSGGRKDSDTSERKRSAVTSGVMKSTGDAELMNNTETIVRPFKAAVKTTHEEIFNIECLGFYDPTPPFSKQKLCKFCGNKGYACHNKTYSTYCTKACLDYLIGKNSQDGEDSDGWLTGFDLNVMERIFTTAYNEKRRVELEEMHGYYSPDSFKVPECMKRGSMRHAISLADNPKLCGELSNHNKGGYERWMEAKSNFRG